MIVSHFVIDRVFDVCSRQGSSLNHYEVMRLIVYGVSCARSVCAPTLKGCVLSLHGSEIQQVDLLLVHLCLFIFSWQGDTLKEKGLIYPYVGVAKKWALMMEGGASSRRDDEGAGRGQRGPKLLHRVAVFGGRVSGISK
jgi:hypothetical protein